MMKKTLLYSTAITVSLFLVFLGMRMPDLSRLHSPKPRPRALIETTVKAGQAAGTKVDTDVAAFTIPPPLRVPAVSFNSRFQEKFGRLTLFAVYEISARAPPSIPV